MSKANINMCKFCIFTMQGLRTKFELDLMELQMTGLAKVSHHQNSNQHNFNLFGGNLPL